MADKVLEMIDRLENVGIVPVIKLEDTTQAVNLAQALINGGINCAEVTFRAAGADKVIKDMTTAFPDMLVGAGTVLTVEQADKAIEAGAKFLVAPGLNPKVVKHCLDKGVPFMPGVATSSEIEQALELGLKAVKFFPAEQAGGLNYIKAVCGPYSGIRFMPTGGVNEENLNAYLAYDRIFACGGSWMVNADLINQKKWDEITQLARSAVNKMLGFEIAHVGINQDSEDEAVSVAKSFENAFGFVPKIGNSSVFAGSGIEIMKSKYLGASGHIAVKTNSIKRAIYALKTRGFECDMETAKYDAKGKMVAVYLRQEFGGFAIHLLAKS